MVRASLPILLLLAVGPLLAQQGGTPATGQGGRLLFSARHFGVEEGLPDRNVRCITQDDRGFIWVGTQRGLARFDGYGFHVYTVADGLASNDVASIARDGNGMLWVLHPKGAVDIMDPLTGRAESLQRHFTRRLPQRAVGAITSLVASNAGVIVFARNGYLFRYGTQGKVFEQVEVEHPSNSLLLVRALNEKGEALCTERGIGQQWANTCILMAFGDPANGQAPHEVLRIQSPAFFTQYMTNDFSGWHPSTPTGFYISGIHGQEWLNPSGVLQLLAPRKPSLRQLLFGEVLLMPLTDDIWLVNTEVVRMRAGDLPLPRPSLFKVSDLDKRAAGLPRALFRDRSGTIWAGGEFGLFKITMGRSYFQQMLQDSSTMRGDGYRVRGMVEEGGRLHVNTEMQGYWVLNAGTGAVIQSEQNAIGREPMVPDGHGGLWRGEQPELLHERPDGTVDRTISSAPDAYPIWSLLPLKDGRILIGSTHGLRITAAGKDSSRVLLADDPALNKAWVWSFTQDADGGLFACTSSGLFRFNTEGHVMDHWWSGASKARDPDHHWPCDDIRYLYQDTAGVCWAATAQSGLLRWDRAAHHVQVIRLHGEGAEAAIHAVLPDTFGDLWLPTDNGLVRYDPVSGAIKIFTTEDGLPSNEFNRLAYTQGRSGRFYLGGMNGLVAFDPADLHKTDTKPMAPLVLESVHLQGEGNRDLEDLTVPVLGGAPITMHPTDRFFTLGMALLSYEDPARIRYAWRIDGADTQWNEQQEPTLRINTLAYGHHVLHIKAQDASGRWTKAQLAIPIIMLRPLWMRWWAILGLLLLATLAVRFVIRYRERQLRNMIHMRDHIAADLHDEVGSTLSSIVLFSAAMGRQGDALSNEAMGMLTRIKDNSTRAMESMNDIVWSVNSGHDSVEHLLIRMRTYARPLCEAAGITVDFELDGDVSTRKLGMEQRKNLYLVFKEAVNNAVRHAHASRIVVHLGLVAGALELAVADNGTGLPGCDVERATLGGNGLGNMERRAAEVGGSLRIRAAEGGGTRVVFRLAEGK